MNPIVNKLPKTYQPDVSRFLALCGRNYARILKWLPEDLDINHRIMISGEHSELAVKLVENTKYTQLIEIYREVGGSSYMATPQVHVRIYHDAKLAEVLTSQQIYKLNPVYDYPNVRMYQRDEKYQVNAFLEELLKIGRRVVLERQS